MTEISGVFRCFAQEEEWEKPNNPQAALHKGFTDRRLESL
jgi:hypothetical protein